MTGEVPRHELELIADEIMADIKRWHVSDVTASAERSLRAAILARLAGIWLTASRAFLGSPLTRGRGDD
jgi:hypothetical protein